MKLGVIGGLGPMATVYFMELVTKMTDAACDQEHLEMLVHSCPSTPDRTKYILGLSDENPLSRMLEIGQGLAAQGADVIAIPCMTAHFFHEQLDAAIPVPVIHGIRKTVECVKNAGVKTVGVMATDGTIRSGLFQQEIEDAGMQTALPDAEYQRKIMDMIYLDIKAGKMPELDRVRDVIRHLMVEKGAQVVILGCTELSLIKKTYEQQLKVGVVDTLEVLAREAVLLCEKKLNPEYGNLCVPEEGELCSRQMS